MSTIRRGALVAMSAAAVSAVLAFGSVAAQDASAAAMDEMEPMESMEEGLNIREPWTRASMMVDLANAVYAVIHNNTDADDALVAASSPVAGVVEIHETSMDAEGLMVMMPVAEVLIPAHGDAVLEPGGYHIMLINLAEALEEGQEIEVTFEFASAKPQTVMVPVRSIGPMDGMDMDGDMDDMSGMDDDAPMDEPMDMDAEDDDESDG